MEIEPLSNMAAAFYLLLVIGHVGFFDVLYFHTYRCGLQHRLECQREVFWHTLRHLIYGCPMERSSRRSTTTIAATACWGGWSTRSSFAVSCSSLPSGASRP